MKKTLSILENIISKLDEYTKNGGDVNSLKKSDTLYQYIKNAKLLDENGKKICVEKKFEIAGFPRTPQRASNVKASLIEDINEYIEKNGNLYQEASLPDFPFYERFKTYRRSLNGKKPTFEEILQDLGFDFNQKIFDLSRPINKERRKNVNAKI